jgi:hypothetical protein
VIVFHRHFGLARRKIEISVLTTHIRTFEFFFQETSLIVPKTSVIAFSDKEEENFSMDALKKLLLHSSWNKYLRMKDRLREEHQNRTDLNKFQWSLLSLDPLPCQNIEGAFFSLELFVQKFVNQLVVRDLIGPHSLKPTLQIEWKLVFDEMKLWSGHLYRTVSLQIMDTSQIQNPFFCTTVGLARIAGTNQELKRLTEEMKLREFVSWLENLSIETIRGVFPMKIIESCDWDALAMELGAPFANQKGEICFFCHENTSHLENWWQDNDIFHILPIDREITDWPRALVPLPLEDRRYDPMHCLRNNLLWALRHIFTLAPRYSRLHTPFKTIVSEIHPGWDLESSISCKEMKEFFERNLHYKIGNLFHSEGKTLLLHKSSIQKSFGEIALMILDGFRFFKDFVYTPWPNSTDFINLEKARRNILIAAASCRWRFTVTTHYAISHLVTFLRSDRTGWYCLNEAVEREHLSQREQQNNVWKGAVTPNDPRHRCKRLLGLVQLNREIDLNYLPIEFQDLNDWLNCGVDSFSLPPPIDYIV